MHWKHPPKIKIYEALGGFADGRLKEEDGEIRVYSSSGKKFYIVKFSEKENAIMSNDNGSYWQCYLGYPMILFLMKIGKIKFDKNSAQALCGIKWKDLNTKFKNDFERTIKYCHKLIQKNNFDLEAFLQDVEKINQQIKKLKFKKLGKRIAPPKGY